jgi:hypothetical protein
LLTLVMLEVLTVGLAAHGRFGYYVAMSFLLRHIGRYAAQKLAADPRAREKAAKIARVVVGEVRQIARGEDRARAAGRALRRAMNKWQGDR